MDTSEHLDQRRFAGTIFADQGMHFSLEELEVDGLQCLDTWKGLADLLHAEEAITRHPSLLSPPPDPEFSALMTTGLM